MTNELRTSHNVANKLPQPSLRTERERLGRPPCLVVFMRHRNDQASLLEFLDQRIIPDLATAVRPFDSAQGRLRGTRAPAVGNDKIPQPSLLMLKKRLEGSESCVR